MTPTLLLDLVVVAMLAATIVVVVALDRRLRALRDARGDLERLATAFGDAIARAESAVARLKGIVTEAQSQSAEASRLAADLSDLIERGEALADRLEAGVRRRAAPAAAAVRETRPPVVETGEDRPQPRSTAERELLQALRASGLAG